MDSGNLLQGLGLMVCIGAILLVALIAFAARAMSRGRNTNANPADPTIWNTPGSERPRYDQPDIETQGGFGGVPTTGDRTPLVDRDFDRDRNPPIDDDERASSGDRLVDYNRNRGREDDNTPPRNVGGFGGEANPPRRRDQADDDDVRSSGGFGGG